jgi:N-acetylmuramoyl-L-alanine amidase
MSTRRTARRSARVTRRRPWLIPAIAAVVLLLVAGGVALAVSKVKTASIKPVTKDAVPAAMPSIPSTDEATPTVASGESTAAVEVPSVLGKPVSTGVTIINAAGLKTVTRVADKAVAGSPADAVVAQDPPQGTKVPAGTTVTLTYNPKVAPAAAPATNVQPAPTGIVVAIDAGHQAQGDSSLEPIGPGSKTMKAKVASGASGRSAPHNEYELTLLVSLKLQKLLADRGIKVVMIRTTNDVNISNSRRAQIANEAHANLLVRVHFDGVNSSSVSGISTLYGKGNSWVDPYSAASFRAADVIGHAASQATGAKYNGTVAHSDMTGLNWATVPSMIIEGGFLSNSAEDAKIVTDAYQDKLAEGIAFGVMQYLGR